MLALIALLTTAQAEPLVGFRINGCVGFGTHCPIAQLGFAYNAKRIAVDIGFIGPLPVGAHLGLQYYPSTDDNNRWFVGTSIGAGSMIFVSVAGFGGYIGRDFHLFDSKQFIITPRLGWDVGGAYIMGGTWGSASEMGSSAAFSLETAYAF